MHGKNHFHPYLLHQDAETNQSETLLDLWASDTASCLVFVCLFVCLFLTLGTKLYIVMDPRETVPREPLLEVNKH